MNIRCSYCRNSFNLGRDFIAHAVAEADEKRQKHVGVECIKCRKMIKVPVKQMRRFVPRQEAAAEEEEVQA